jgi:hypothetical protein
LTYVHDKYTGFVEFVYDFFGWDTDCANEKLGLFLDNDIDKFIEFTFGIIVVCLSSIGSKGGDQQIDSECYLSALTL